jgi:hypothetical protein
MFRIRWADGAPDSLVDDVSSVADLRRQVREKKRSAVCALRLRELEEKRDGI